MWFRREILWFLWLMLWCLHAVDNDVYDTYIDPRGEEGIIKPNKPIDKNQINEKPQQSGPMEGIEKKTNYRDEGDVKIRAMDEELFMHSQSHYMQKGW
jgi:hypothetical protein